ncbi:hypothetical protein CGZ90_17060 [Fictibacillus aquaticus]|uniref:Uncharacterized protein n=1 Tax=Fictibacillus aquaticus TaxID=2021314 RepID=A0A235F696_9BACL|nr:hypothetical protein CGZ90_17060 [Fictibacillus aquaticus]
MWEVIAPFIPDKYVFFQAIVVFLVPFCIAMFYSWMHSLEKE